MKSIQEAGSEILGNRPDKIYIFTGKEYGIKSRYIKHLENFYGDYSEIDSMKDFIKFSSTKRLIPLKPKLYILRYDEEFISSINQSTEKVLNQLNIVGTLVVVYENDKHCTKVEKSLPNYCVHVDAVDRKYIKKYLSSEYKKLNPLLIENISNLPISYNHCRMICESMLNCSLGVGVSDLVNTFGVELFSKDDLIKKYIASKNVLKLYEEIDKYKSDKNNIIYTILSTMLEIEKCLVNKRYNSELREYIHLWELEDVYNMFSNTYNQLNKLRTYTSDLENSIYHLISLIGFSRIPGGDLFRGITMSN